MTRTEVRLLTDLDPSAPLYLEWEQLVAANPASGIMQSLPWAQFKAKQGLTPIHFGVFEDNRLSGGAIFYTTNRSHGVGLLVAPEGPVLPWDDEPRAGVGLHLIMEAAGSYARQCGIMAMRIEPRLAPPTSRILREFGRAPLDLIPRDTLYIDLTSPAETILAGMKEKGRYNIGLSARRGVKVHEEHTAAAVERFYPIIAEASERDKFALEPYSFFEKLAGTLCPSGNAKFLFAEHDGDLLGTILLISHGSRATYLYGGITNKKRNLMGGYALQWAAMMAAKQAGCQTYDFYGFDPFRAPHNPYARFSQFKSQFGGSVVRLNN